MKKLMIAAAIVCAAAFAQAASCNWGAVVADPAGDAKEGQIALLLFSKTQAGLATKLNGFAIGSEADNGYTVVDQHVLTAEEVPYEVSKFYDMYDAENVNGYYQIVLLSEDKTHFDGAIPDNVEYVTGVTDQTAPGTALYNTEWANPDAYLGANGYTGVVESVPEPTSGLLLLIGVAGLALRRRRA